MTQASWRFVAGPRSAAVAVEVSYRSRGGFAEAGQERIAGSCREPKSRICRVGQVAVEVRIVVVAAD